ELLELRDVVEDRAQLGAVAVELLGRELEPRQLRHFLHGFPVDGHAGVTLADPPGHVYHGRVKRAGGWTLGLVAVIGMAAAGFLGLRPILFRKPIAVEFVMVADWTPEQET